MADFRNKSTKMMSVDMGSGVLSGNLEGTFWQALIK